MAGLQCARAIVRGAQGQDQSLGAAFGTGARSRMLTRRGMLCPSKWTLQSEAYLNRFRMTPCVPTGTPMIGRMSRTSSLGFSRRSSQVMVGSRISAIPPVVFVSKNKTCPRTDDTRHCAAAPPENCVLDYVSLGKLTPRLITGIAGTRPSRSAVSVLWSRWRLACQQAINT